MAISLPVLPYEMDALEPTISARTLSYHHGKHHQGYVNKTNARIEGTALDDLSLEDLIRDARVKADIALLNNAAQSWNHSFLWQSMSPNGGGEPSGRIKELVEEEFGSVERFQEEFKKAATSQFGSGWTWLVLDNGKLRILNTSNADSPVATHMEPLLTLDVWEHAYYLDHQNDRGAYVTAFLNDLINWDFAAANLKNSKLREVA